MNIPNDTLSQWFEKDHLDLKNELSQKEWELFLDQYNEVYINETSEIANNLFDEFTLNYLKKKDYKMKTLYHIESEVEIDLSLLDDDDIKQEAEERDYIILEKEPFNIIYHKMELGEDTTKEVKELIYNTIGRIL